MKRWNLRTDKVSEQGVRIAYLSDRTKLVFSSILDAWVYCLRHVGATAQYVGPYSLHIYGWGVEGVSPSDLTANELQELLTTDAP